jgi:ribosomal protein L40E
MMFRFHECPECHQRNPQGSGVCVGCGSTLQRRFCFSCGAANDVLASNCRACGEAMPATGVVSSRSSFAPATAQADNALDPIFGRTVIESAPQGVAAARTERANRAVRAPAANSEAAAQAADTARGLTRRRRRIALVPILILAAVGGGIFIYRLQSDAGSSSQVQAPSPKRTTGATVTAIGAAAAPLTSPAAGPIKPALQSRELAPTTAIVPESTPAETTPAADPASTLANPTPAASVAPPAPKAAVPPHRTAGPAAAPAPPNRAITIRTQAKQPCTPNLAALALCSPD